MVFCVIEWVLRRCWVSGLLRKHVDGNKGKTTTWKRGGRKGLGELIWYEFLQTQITRRQPTKRGGGVKSELGRRAVKWGMGREDWGDEKKKGGKETLTGLTEAETKAWSRRLRGGDRKWCKEMKMERARRKKVTSCGVAEKDGDGWSIQGQRKLLKSWIQRVMYSEREIRQQDGLKQGWMTEMEYWRITSSDGRRARGGTKGERDTNYA